MGVNDLVGSKAAMSKALHMAQAGDSVVGVHIPKMAPELLFSSMDDIPDEEPPAKGPLPFTPEQFLTSMTDPQDAGPDQQTTLSKVVSGMQVRSADELQQHVKEFVGSQMVAMGKQVDVTFKQVAGSGDVKLSLVDAAKREGAEYLFVGPGAAGNGRVPSFLASKGNGMTIFVVRDNLVE